MENSSQYTTIARAIRFIRERYTAQPGLEEIAGHVHLSKYHFQRLFQSWAGISPKQFLQFITTEHAKRALAAGQSTLETAWEVGLSGNGRLHDLFVKMEACTPGEFKQRGHGLVILSSEFDTPFGRAFLAETDRGICKLAFVDGPGQAIEELHREFPHANILAGEGPNGRLVRQYFHDWELPGSRIALDLVGTPFQIQVWKALLSIPPAQMLSYGDIAGMVGKPGASRAIGAAVGRNPVAYLIPCHRVIRENGETSGYRWSPERKLAINAFESARLGNREESPALSH